MNSGQFRRRRVALIIQGDELVRFIAQRDESPFFGSESILFIAVSDRRVPRAVPSRVRSGPCARLDAVVRT
jgi:hypothetical protein